jgi:hypothetical protein
MRNPWKKLIANVKISGRVWHIHKNKPKREVNITWQDLQKKFEEQGCKCHWFGIDVDPQDIFETHNPLAPSVDRLDNDKEYEIDNIVICCRLANLGKGNAPSSKFLQTAKDLKRRILRAAYAEYKDAKRITT